MFFIHFLYISYIFIIYFLYVFYIFFIYFLYTFSIYIILIYILPIMFKKQKFDYTKYFLKEESIFINKEFGNEFYKMLKEELNTEPYDFIIEVYTLKENKMDNDKEKIKKINTIIETYILNDSKKELNLSNDFKKNFIESYKNQKDIYDKWILVISINNIFNDILDIIKKELLIDKFSRFIRKEECKKLIEKYYKDDTIIITKRSKDFLYDKNDIQTKIITEKDIELLNAISEDSYNWILTKSYNDNYGYKSNSYYSSNVKEFLPSLKEFNNSSIMKTEIICPLHFDKVYKLVFDLENMDVII